MPTIAPTPCAHPGCYETTQDTRCEEHAKKQAMAYDQRRGSARERGYDREWEKVIRPEHLMLEPFCRSCHAEGRAGVPGTVVDHVIPHRGARWLFRLRANLQTLCKPCHDVKSGKEAHADIDGLYPLSATQEPRRWTREKLYALMERKPRPRLAELAFWAHVAGVRMTLNLAWQSLADCDRVAVEAMQRRAPGGIDFFQGVGSGTAWPALIMRDPISSRSQNG